IFFLKKQSPVEGLPDQYHVLSTPVCEFRPLFLELSIVQLHYKKNPWIKRHRPLHESALQVFVDELVEEGLDNMPPNIPVFPHKLSVLLIPLARPSWCLEKIPQEPNFHPSNHVTPKH